MVGLIGLIRLIGEASSSTTFFQADGQCLRH